MNQEILLFIAGIIVGGMNAIAGGGMLFGFPIMLASGMPAIAANATSHVALIPGQIGALISYRKYLKKVSPIYLALVIPLILGAGVGAHFLTKTHADDFERLIPILLAFAVGLFALQPFLHKHFHAHLKSKNKNLAGLGLMGLIAFPLAIYGGYFGVGFGFVLLAFLGFSKIHDIHKINAIKNVGTFVIAITTTMVLFGSGLIDWRSGLFMATGCGIGGFYGGHLAQRFSSHAIRLFIIAVGVLSVIFLFLKNY